MNAWRALVQREGLLVWRHPADALSALAFAAVVCALVPLGVGAEPQLLARAGSGVVWVAALLATLLTLPRLYAADWSDGSLDQLSLGVVPLWGVAACKSLVHWLTCGLPLALISPLLGLQFGLEGAAIGVLGLSLLLGTPQLSLIGGMVAALSVGTRGGALLMALLGLPLFIPALVFGSGAVVAQQSGLSPWPQLQVLLGLSVLAVVVMPGLTGMAVGVALE